MGINLSDWAALVQDVAAGLQALPPGLSNCLGPEVINLLQLLDAATGVGFCCLCCNLEPHCRCVGVPQSAPPTSWSQILEQTPGYGTTSSAGEGDYSEYLLGRYAQTGATSLRDLHLEPISREGAYTLAAGHKPTIQASRWEGQLAKGHAEREGSAATGSSDGSSHTSAASTPPELTCNPVPADGATAS